jgi:hypothetical protein
MKIGMNFKFYWGVLCYRIVRYAGPKMNYFGGILSTSIDLCKLKTAASGAVQRQ